MATCRQIITSALRKVFVVTEGQPAPEAYDAANALVSLQAWYDEAMVGGTFGRLTDVLTEAAYTAKEFQRITNTSGGSVTVTLPETVTDDISGEERAPLDLAPVVVIDPGATPLNYVYDGIVGDWVSLVALTLDSQAPLSTRGSDGLACVLATRLTEHGEPKASTIAGASRFLATIGQRNGSQRRDVGHEFF